MSGALLTEQSEKDAAIIRQMIQHEDVVLQSRFTWMTTSQTLLVAALAFAWEKAPDAFTYILSLTGLTLSASTLYATVVLSNSMVNLEEMFQKRHPSYSGIDVISKKADSWNNIIRPSRAFPTIFGIMWVLIALMRHVMAIK